MSETPATALAPDQVQRLAICSSSPHLLSVCRRVCGISAIRPCPWIRCSRIPLVYSGPPKHLLTFPWARALSACSQLADDAPITSTRDTDAHTLIAGYLTIYPLVTSYHAQLSPARSIHVESSWDKAVAVFIVFTHAP
ncbi:hypothetical protein AG1IA_02877 [Rhizoctonia solani AG-1 IA]|uniref:Uncharacterized protein n=1 Tax=Thanatephorus cucumeris (strain AG1-IA) TaxID=983506 RepID=L8X386_THACA|nr:hypothetical protein AG1IA_02877 [Rhizoctonia solani AG-1 IA]